MKVVNPKLEIEIMGSPAAILQSIERIGRTCYKSEEKINPTSAEKFVKNIINSGHESVLEHEAISVRIICDRGVSHEIVRHRIASYSQESTRYCNYSQEKFGSEITCVMPYYLIDSPHEAFLVWEQAMIFSENQYFKLLEMGLSPQEARSVLPNSLKTEIVATMNLREWRHFFRLRCDKAAHPQMQQIAIPLLLFFKHELPPIFDDISYNYDFQSKYYAEVKYNKA